MKILFKVYPQRSHYNATFPFAAQLRDQGNDVVYAGIDALKAHVEAQGFSFLSEAEDIYPYAETALPGYKNQSVIGAIRAFFRFRNYARTKWENYDPFASLLRDETFDFVMVDSPYAFFALHLFRHGVKFGILESMMPQDVDPDCPPLCSTFVPRGTKMSRWWCAMLWSGYLLRRWVLGVIGLRPDYNKRLILRQAKRCGVDLKHIELRRYFHIGIRNVPEYLLAPNELDFPRTLRPNQEVFVPASPPRRSEGFGDWAFEGRFTQMVEQRPQVPLLYCSLGTAGWRYKGGMQFLRKVVRVAGGQPWNLILSIGEMDRHQLGTLPENVAVFNTVPQLKVLRSCDLMITHGGMNSIKECYDCKVPMLVYPGNNAIDQVGNAARVVFHGLGIMGSLRRETKSGIDRKIRSRLKRVYCGMPQPERENLDKEVLKNFKQRNGTKYLKFLNLSML